MTSAVVAPGSSRKLTRTVALGGSTFSAKPDVRPVTAAVLRTYRGTRGGGSWYQPKLNQTQCKRVRRRVWPMGGGRHRRARCD